MGRWRGSSRGRRVDRSGCQAHFRRGRAVPDLEFADLVSQRLSGPGDVTIDFIGDVEEVEAELAAI